MNCPSCSTANRDGAAFCINCGRPLKDDPVRNRVPTAGAAASGFASDARVPVAEVDYSAIATAAVASPANLRINKKYISQTTPQQLNVAVAQNLAAGVKPDWLTKNLVKQGVTADQATRMVGDIGRAVDDYKRTPEGRKVVAKKYRNQMIGGFASFVLGTAITVGTFIAADDEGTFFIAYGAVIWGIVGAIMGLVGWLKYRSEQR